MPPKEEGERPQTREEKLQAAMILHMENVEKRQNDAHLALVEALRQLTAQVGTVA